MNLKAHIAARIRAEGPISLSDYMAECLLHPKLGYYNRRDPLGRSGDFITAPEISQMFGELIGLALAQAWMDQGRPARIILAELGPGRGTLMADIRRAAGRVPGFVDAAEIWLVEASPALRAIQAETLAGFDVTWAEHLTDLPERPLFLVANEFLDALPIRQFQREMTGWRECRVGLGDADELVFGLGGETGVPALDHRLEDTEAGDIVEINVQAAGIAESVGSRIAGQGGVALLIDYGDWRTLGDTFQALRNHQTVAPLAEPGEADLTAHVDFEAVAVAAKAGGACFTRLTPQGVFLERLGITARARALFEQADEAGQEQVIAAHRRLTHGDEMGNLFKVMGLYPDGAQPPPGLEP
ncbi:MAG: class I SAM-dependent methyltransferase [Arenibacterium sp.]